MTTADSSNKEIADAFGNFPFTTEQEYQAGLQSILSSNAFNGSSDTEKDNTLRLSRVFYFNKVTGNSITLEDALDFESSTRPIDGSCKTGQQLQPATEGEGPTLTFAELTALINQGKTEDIPNNKVIPNVLNDAPPSEDTGQVRKKPWET